MIGKDDFHEVLRTEKVQLNNMVEWLQWFVDHDIDPDIGLHLLDSCMQIMGKHTDMDPSEEQNQAAMAAIVSTVFGLGFGLGRLPVVKDEDLPDINNVIDDNERNGKTDG
jgi:hypothetical protein